MVFDPEINRASGFPNAEKPLHPRMPALSVLDERERGIVNAALNIRLGCIPVIGTDSLDFNASLIQEPVQDRRVFRSGGQFKRDPSDQERRIACPRDAEIDTVQANELEVRAQLKKAGPAQPGFGMLDCELRAGAVIADSEPRNPENRPVAAPLGGNVIKMNPDADAFGKFPGDVVLVVSDVGKEDEPDAKDQGGDCAIDAKNDPKESAYPLEETTRTVALVGHRDRDLT